MSDEMALNAFEQFSKVIGLMLAEITALREERDSLRAELARVYQRGRAVGLSALSTVDEGPGIDEIMNGLGISARQKAEELLGQEQ